MFGIGKKKEKKYPPAGEGPGVRKPDWTSDEELKTRSVIPPYDRLPQKPTEATRKKP